MQWFSAPLRAHFYEEEETCCRDCSDTTSWPEKCLGMTQKVTGDFWKIENRSCSKSGLSCSEGSGSGTYQLLIDTQFVRLLWGFRKIHNGWWNKATEGRSVFWQDLDLSALVLILCEPQVQPEDLTFCYPTSYTTEHLFGYSYWHNDFHMLSQSKSAQPILFCHTKWSRFLKNYKTTCHKNSLPPQLTSDLWRNRQGHLSDKTAPGEIEAATSFSLSPFAIQGTNNSIDWSVIELDEGTWATQSPLVAAHFLVGLLHQNHENNHLKHELCREKRTAVFLGHYRVDGVDVTQETERN